MFKDDEDDEDSGGTTAVRYACMPSLVSLQQMRNRLHLAYTGKKLMKWTALATGRELRKLATAISESYESFRDDMRNCFMYLARARYFSPYLNQMVVENCGKSGALRVERSSKSISGVKVALIQILEPNKDTYAHLGIGKGGYAIITAKRAWRELLKRLIMMLQQRVGFTDLEIAHRSATKRQNVLQRVVIPRTMATMRYILDELDEFSREEFYRIKMILANKYKVKNRCPHHNVPDLNCEMCIRMLKLNRQMRDEEIGQKLKERKEEKEDDEVAAIKMSEKDFEQEEQKYCIICGSILLDTVLGEMVDDAKDLSHLGKLEEFKAQLSEIVVFSKDMKGLPSIESFIKDAEKLRDKLESEKLKPISSDTPINLLCNTCRLRFMEEQRVKAMQKAAGEKIAPTEETPPTGTKPTEDSLHTRFEEAVEWNTDYDQSIKSDQLQTESVVTTKSVIISETPEVFRDDLELGTFEVEVEETTQIVRTKNEDGTISEKKRVVRKQKERRIPQNDEDTSRVASSHSRGSPGAGSSTSRNKSQSRTVGVVTMGKSGIWQNIRKIRSNVLPLPSLVAHPIEKCCLSSPSFFSTSIINFNCFSSESISSVCESTRKCFLTSSAEFEEMLHLHELHTSQQLRQPSSNYFVVCKENCRLTDSDIMLIQNSHTYNKTVNKSKSIDDTQKTIRQNRIITSISFNIDNVSNNSESEMSNNWKI